MASAEILRGFFYLDLHAAFRTWKPFCTLEVRTGSTCTQAEKPKPSHAFSLSAATALRGRRAHGDGGTEPLAGDARGEVRSLRHLGHLATFKLRTET